MTNRSILSLVSRRMTTGQEGFSLVEILLAMGIVLFACLSILGVVPIGLSTLRDSGQNSVTSQIVDRIHGELQQADFTTLTQGGKVPSEEDFDSQGNLLPALDSTAPFKAYITVIPSTTLPGTSTESSNLATVQILIQSHQGQVSASQNIQAFSLLMADSDPTNTEQ
jgi:uncharacterized protein (TIGR02598 family)